MVTRRADRRMRCAPSAPCASWPSRKPADLRRTPSRSAGLLIWTGRKLGVRVHNLVERVDVLGHVHATTGTRRHTRLRFSLHEARLAATENAGMVTGAMKS